MAQLQTGGAKLIHPEKNGFSATFDMLTSEGSLLQLLTYTSLYGFMFELVVRPDLSEYYTNDAAGRLTTPITNFILKIVVTTPVTVTLPPYNGVKKVSETPETFLNEAKTQQSIWLQSISGGRPEICPAVANLSLFDNAQSRILIYWLFFIFGKKGINRRNEVTDALHYLLYILTKPMCGVAIILMPKIMNSSTFSNFVRPPSSPTSSEILEAISNIFAQVVRLFIVNGIIHTDLHKSNVLVYPSTTGIKSEIIDFGRVINIKDMRDVKKKIDDIIDIFFTIIQPTDVSFAQVNQDRQNIEKQQFIKNVIDYIQSVIDTQIMPPKNAQMLWLIEFANAYPHVYLQAFDTFKNYYVISANKSTRMSPSTIASYISKGIFYGLDRPLRDFYVSLPDLNDNEYAFSSKTAMTTSSVQMASAPQQPVVQQTVSFANNPTTHAPLKRSRQDNTQYETERPLGRTKINNDTERTIVDDNDTERTIVDDNDNNKTNVGGKKSRRKQKSRRSRERRNNKQSRRNKMTQRKRPHKKGK